MLRQNLIANVAGTAWSGLLTLALVPLYVRFLGTESYGLIGFYVSVSVVVVLLDFGLGITVNRAVSRLGSGAAGIFRTAETLYWAIGLAAGAVLWLAAPWLAEEWFVVEKLSPRTVTAALRFAAAAVACRFPYGLYAAALYGLQRHVALNVVVIVTSSFRAAVAVVLVVVARADVAAVMAGEVVACIVQTALAAAVAYRVLPAEVRAARVQWAALRESWGFARTVAAIGVLSAVVSQIDKLVVSRFLPLGDFGAYAVAMTIGNVVTTIVTPIHSTVFPRLAQLAARGEEAAVAATFRRATHLLAATVFPAAAVAAFFSRELIVAWTGDAALASHVRWIAVFVVAGSALYAAMSIPYALQLAHGWLVPSVVKTAASVLLLVPATIWGVKHHGALGAAAAWLAINALALATDVVATHVRLLPGTLWRWVWRDAALPALAAVAACAALRALFDAVPQPPLVVLAAAGTAAFTAAALTILDAARR